MSTDGPDLDLVAAALRADAQDIDSFAAVLFGTLGDALPDGMVEVVRRPTLGARLLRRTGAAEALVTRIGDHVLTLRQAGPGRLEAEYATTVRGVVISRRPVGVDEWARVLAVELSQLAAESGAAREALRRILGG